MAELSIRIDFGPGKRLGPGKIELLEHIVTHGSIAAGGRALRMSYRRAWELVDELNKIFDQPVLLPKTGGKKGGGAELTPLGLALISRYRAIELAASAAAAAQLLELNAVLPATRRKKSSTSRSGSNADF
jgi:molybdate transport system regulatory protein